MRTFVLGDIHGAYRALKQCLEKSRFDTADDHLIFLGDVCDRGPETVESINLLLSLDNLTALMGNHDKWLMDWLAGTLEETETWLRQGGQATYDSYTRHDDFNKIREVHYNQYFKNLLPFYKDSKNRVFVHAGFNWQKPIEETDSPLDYFWDRELFRKAVAEFDNPLKFPVGAPYDEIFIGHSPTHRLLPEIDGTVPLKLGNVWCLDQGAGWGQKLSMIDLETKEVFQSDKVEELY